MNIKRHKYVNDDYIWFTEKNSDGATVLYPLTDFKGVMVLIPRPNITPPCPVSAVTTPEFRIARILAQQLRVEATISTVRNESLMLGVGWVEGDVLLRRYGCFYATDGASF